jgi:hypothetical protein
MSGVVAQAVLDRFATGVVQQLKLRTGVLERGSELPGGDIGRQGGCRSREVYNEFVVGNLGHGAAAAADRAYEEDAEISVVFGDEA